MRKEREITIYDIATELDLSSGTVSRGLNNDPGVHPKTRKRISDMAEKMGYRPNLNARNFRSRNTNTIGFIAHELHSNFMNAVLAGVEQVTAAAGYDLLIAHSLESFEREAANARNFFEKRIEGLIASLSFDTKTLDHFRPFLDHAVPVIFFDRVEKSKDITAVVIDNYTSAYDATRHLIGQGCKRIMHVTASLTRNVYSERYEGYRDALTDHQLLFDDKLLFVSDLSEQAGIEAAHRILNTDPRPDGAFITNDFVAAICMRTLKEHGITIPGDVAVVGFNNDIISQIIEPALTTINYPGKEIGSEAAQTLVDNLKDKGKSTRGKTIIIHSELIVRDSSLRK